MHGDLLTTVLRLHTLPNDIALMEKIPDTSVQAANKILQQLGALDEQDRITVSGKALLSIGLNLRLGRFLLACDTAGCVNSGATLAALLTVDATLLPGK